MRIHLLVIGTVVVAAAARCPVVTVVYQAPYSQVNASLAPDNVFGVEDGVVVRRADGGFQMIAAEMYDSPKWVKMRLGVWSSRDGMSWRRVRTLRNSSANFDGTDPHSSSWGPFLTLDPTNDTWALTYVGYRGAASNDSGWLENYHGIIYGQYASVSGDAGLDSDFGDAGDWRATDRVLLAPDDFSVVGPWPHPCQGLQGTDSMYAYPLEGGGWAALAGTSFQENPDHMPNTGKWPVSGATAPSMFGPWTRRNPSGGRPADAPCVDLNGGYSENPIVSRRPDDATAFQLVIDWIGQEGDGFGYACSDDGLAWEPAVFVKSPGGCRTPFGFVPMTAAEITEWTPSIVAYGVINASQIGAHNTSMAWLYYSQQQGGWEVFRAAFVQFQW